MKMAWKDFLQRKLHLLGALLGDEEEICFPVENLGCGCIAERKMLHL